MLDGRVHAEELLAQYQEISLLVAHVAGMFNLTNGKRAGCAWSRHFAECGASRSVALHTWLFHLGGGAAANYALPVHAESRILHGKVERVVKNYYTRRSELQSTLRQRAARSTPLGDLPQQLEEPEALWVEEFDWDMLPKTEPQLPPAPPPPPPPPAPTDEGSLSSANLRLLIARGVGTADSPLH